LLDLKPGAVLRLSCPEIRISDCFDPVRVEIWVKDFRVFQNGSFRGQVEQLAEVTTLLVITDKLRCFMRQRVGNNMAVLASNWAVDRSPGLKSQVSAEEDSDVENLGNALVSQTNFATQVPFSPPKALEKASTRQGQLLGKRKVMCDLRQLVSDTSRTSKKNKIFPDDGRSTNIVFNMQTDVDRAEVMATSGKSALERECPTREQNDGSCMSGRGRTVEKNASLRDLNAAETNTTNRQSDPSPTSNTNSNIRVLRFDDHLETLIKWRDRLSKTTYLPRYLQTISRAQNDLLSADDRWQPALVGQPTRPGTLPLDLLNKLTAAADQKAVVVHDAHDTVPSNQQLLPGIQEISQSEANGVNEESDLPSNSPIMKAVAQAHDQSQAGAQRAQSESDDTSLEWSLSPPRSPSLKRVLPPDSSPLQAARDMSVPSPPVEGASTLIRKSEDESLSGPFQLPSIKDGVESSQWSRHHSNNPESSVYTHITNMKTSSNLKEKPDSRPLSDAAGASISQAEADSSCSKTKFSRVEHAITALGPNPMINSSYDFARDIGLENTNFIQASETPHTARPPTSSVPQPQSHEVTECPLNTLQKQPGSQQFPSPSSSQLISGTFLQKNVGSRLTNNLQDSHDPKESMEEFEINSSEDGSVHDPYTVNRVANHQDGDKEADASRQAMMEIQSATQVPPNASGYSEGVDNGTTAYYNHGYSKASMVPEDRVTVVSDFNSSGQRRQCNTDKEELPKHSKPAKPTISSSMRSVSSEEPDCRRVDNMTRQYRRVIFSTLRKTDIAAPLPPSAVLASNVSPQSESLQSIDRRYSAQTSILRQATTSTPLTSNSAQAQKTLSEHPISTSELSKKSSLQPENQFLVFKQNYPTYGGNFIQFLMSCRMIKKVRTAGKLLPQGVWDDYVCRHNHDYRSYLDDIAQSNEPESPIPYEEFYVDYVSEPVYLKGVLKLAFIDALSAEIDPIMRPGTTLLRKDSEIDHLHRHKRSISASSSASNRRPKECLADTLEKVTGKDDLMTWETQLQLKEQEEAHQSHPSSVHLWLQKASGAASPELGTSETLAVPGDIPYIDLTQNGERTFDLFMELQTLKTQFANRRKGSRRSTVEEARLPNAKTEPFKYFSLGHARLDANHYRTSKIQTNAKGALRPEVQRIVDIFTWRSLETSV
jgi:hypothetical protein